MTKIKMVVFDMAGTTVKDNNEVEKCFTEAARQTDLPYERKDILAMMGWSKRKVFSELWEKALPDLPGGKREKLIESSYISFKNILENHYRTEPVIPTDHCIETFEELKKRNIKIALTTGFYREVTNIILSRLGWNKNLDSNYIGNGKGFIDISVTSDEVEAGRPEPFMIQRAMKLLGINNPEEVIKVGDTPSDLLAGKKAGCKFSFAVCNGTHTREQLEAVVNDGLLNHVGELIDFI